MHARSRRLSSVFSAASVALLLGACGPDAGPVLEPEVEVRFEVVENRVEDGRATFVAAFDVMNRGPASLQDWSLYYNFFFEVAAADSTVVAERIKGDFQRLRELPVLEPGDSARFELEGTGAVVKVSDAPSGPYIVRTGDGGSDILTPVSYARSVAPPGGPWPEGRPTDWPMIPTPESRFRAYARAQPLPPEEVTPVVPTPVSLERRDGGTRLDGTWTVRFDPEVAGEAELLADALGRLLGARPETAPGGPGPGIVHLAVAGDPSDPSGAYRVDVGADRVTIRGRDRAGVFYGTRTLLALAPPEAFGGSASFVVPRVAVEDAPRFEYRGLHLDVARNFHSKETVEKLLDLMAFYKLNRFHMHLSDDEGWRLEIRDLPELTEVGSRRGHTLDEREHLVPSFGSGPDPGTSRGSGHYTRDDFVEILRWAKARHILVVPEIDVPGHARAAVRSMQVRHDRLVAEGRVEEARAYLLTDPGDDSQYRSVQGWDDNVIDVCLPSTYRFLGTVFDELVALYEEADAELIAVHIGGDEVPRGAWEGSPACRRLVASAPELDDVTDLPPMFFDRVSRMLQERGLQTAGWEDIALIEDPGTGPRRVPNPDLVDRGLLPFVWNNLWHFGAEELGYRLANAGYPVVLANATNLYFDLAYDRDPLEPGFTWAGLTDTRTVYEFAPHDLYVSAREDILGRPVDPDAEYAGAVRLTPEGRANVRGIQGQLWGENARSRDALEYLAFPKLLALAERAWAPRPAWATLPTRAAREPALDAAWSEFANRLGQRELPRLDRMAGGVAYRLPPPGLRRIAGRVHANTPFPGLAIHYSVDGSEPTAASPRYEGPVDADVVRARVFDTRERGGRESRLGG